MLEKLSNNILLDAAVMLKKQNRADNENFGISFDQLFEIKSSKNENQSSQSINTAAENRKIESSAEKRSFENDINNETIEQKQKNVQKNNIEENAGSLNPDIKARKAANESKINTEKNKNTNADDLNLTLFSNIKVNDLAFRNLSVGDKEKIKNIIRDVKAGIISENTAKLFIDQIMRSGAMNRINSAETGRIKSDSKNNADLNLKSLKSNVNGNEKLDAENKNKKITNSAETKESGQFTSALKKQMDKNDKIEKMLKNEPDSGIKENKTSEINLKDFKFDLSLNTSDNKTSSANHEKANSARTLELNKDSLFYDLAKNTKIVMGNNQTSFSTMIRPENFGRIDLNFIMKDGKLNGKMIMQTQEVADFFRANVEDFKAVLAKSDVNLENLEIILAGNRFANDQGNSQNKENLNQDLKISNNWANSLGRGLGENNFIYTNNYSLRELTNINLVI
jgi:hypothetical protein